METPTLTSTMVTEEHLIEAQQEGEGRLMSYVCAVVYVFLVYFWAEVLFLSCSIVFLECFKTNVNIFCSFKFVGLTLLE